MLNTKLVNREISWLHFNERVLQEAMDPSVPLIERLRFLGIFSNNRDEFFRVRVATVKRMIQARVYKEEKLGFNPEKLLQQILEIVEEQEKKFNKTYVEIIKELKKKNIFFINEKELSSSQSKYVHNYFVENVRPLLFPIILNNLKSPDALVDNSIYLVISVSDSKGEKENLGALVRVPSDQISRFVILPSDNKDDKIYVMLLDDVIRHSIGDIFKVFGYDTFSAYTIKLTRDAELDIDNDIKKSFLELMSESLKKRKKGAPVRFVYDKSIPENLLKKLLKKLHISGTDHLRGGGRYHNFKDFMKFPDLGKKSLVYKKIQPIPHPELSKDTSIIKAIRKNDIFLHYPYHSFQYIVDLLREASIDPNVRAIKMTFYRAARHSNVINALINAARNGKNVTVFLEIQARFDEANNIYWTERLREEGVKIIKALPGFKVHAKIMLIRRKENGENKYYAGISTGNFNENTAKVYTDDTLLTYNQNIANEINELFHLIESPFNPPKFKNILVSPFYLRDTIIKMLNQEIKNAKEGKEAWVLIKLNSLVDEKTVKKLYQASQAGVKIDMIVRGICVLVPGIKGLSENIKIISIVDRFLEHSRVYIFGNGGNPKYYISSADWMIRNFDHRFEAATPVYDKRLQNELWNMLQLQLKDNVKARLVNSEPVNKYQKTESKEKLRSQCVIYDYLASDSEEKCDD